MKADQTVRQGIDDSIADFPAPVQQRLEPGRRFAKRRWEVLTAAVTLTPGRKTADTHVLG